MLAHIVAGNMRQSGRDGGASRCGIRSGSRARYQARLVKAVEMGDRDVPCR